MCTEVNISVLTISALISDSACETKGILLPKRDFVSSLIEVHLVVRPLEVTYLNSTLQDTKQLLTGI